MGRVLFTHPSALFRRDLNKKEDVQQLMSAPVYRTTTEAHLYLKKL